MPGIAGGPEVDPARESARRTICRQFGAEYLYCPDEGRVGVSRQFSLLTPLHGLRHPPERGETGWYVWTGELTDDPSFFLAVAATRLLRTAPSVDPYLGLGPGWRFLLAPGHVDVWFDESLLDLNQS